MSRTKAAYSLFPVNPQRPGQASYWYFAVYDLENRRMKRSTGIVNDGTERSRREAEAVVNDLLKTDSLIPLPPRNFGEFATEFWDWDSSTYVRDRIARDSKAFGRPYVYEMALLVKKHILPVLGALQIEEVTTAQIDALGTKLLKKLSSQSVKHVYNCLRVMFAEARRRGLVRVNPMHEALPVVVRSAKRDPFTPDEVRKLLDMATVEKVWGSTTGKSVPKGYSPWKHWLANAIAACTGRRVSEIIALRVEDFNVAESYIWVRKSVDKLRTMKAGTKTGIGNKIPIDPEIMKIFAAYLPKEGWVFPGRNADVQMTAQTAELILKRAMKNIGISDLEKKERLLGFHSWRHTLVTRAHSLPSRLISAVTEHETEASIDRYTTLSLEDKRAIGGIQKELFFGKNENAA